MFKLCSRLNGSFSIFPDDVMFPIHRGYTGEPSQLIPECMGENGAVLETGFSLTMQQQTKLGRGKGSPLQLIWLRY